MTQFFITSLGKKPGFECSVCHAGDPMAKDKDAAHKGMYVNPSDLSVIEKTCAQCHKDHVGRVEKSLMANARGEIAGTLYARGFTFLLLLNKKRSFQKLKNLGKGEILSPFFLITHYL